MKYEAKAAAQLDVLKKVRANRAFNLAAAIN